MQRIRLMSAGTIALTAWIGIAGFTPHVRASSAIDSRPPMEHVAQDCACEASLSYPGLVSFILRGSGYSIALGDEFHDGHCIPVVCEPHVPCRAEGLMVVFTGSNANQAYDQGEPIHDVLDWDIQVSCDSKAEHDKTVSGPGTYEVGVKLECDDCAETSGS